MQEGGQKVGAAFVADRQPSVGDQPGQRPFHLPSLSAQPDAGLHPTAGDPRSDAAAADRLPAGRVGIAFVGVQLGRAPARSTGSSPWPDDCWDGVHQLLQQQRVGVLAADRPTANGIPVASISRWYLEPALPRSTGLAPVNSPHAVLGH